MPCLMKNIQPQRFSKQDAIIDKWDQHLPFVFRPFFA
jgi:hypothetical protein